MLAAKRAPTTQTNTQKVWETPPHPNVLFQTTATRVASLERNQIVPTGAPTTIRSSSARPPIKIAAMSRSSNVAAAESMINIVSPFRTYQKLILSFGRDVNLRAGFTQSASCHQFMLRKKAHRAQFSAVYSLVEPKYLLLKVRTYYTIL